MLIKDVVKNYRGRVAYVDENYGMSKYAERFGIQRYPAVFVDDALIARPDDFGFYGKDHNEADKGKYTPWQDAENHQRFKQDLVRMIDLRLQGEEIESLSMSPGSEQVIAALPDFELVTIEGTRVSSRDLSGRAVLVEFWAPWCPPCQRTLSWMADLKQTHGDKLAILAVAVQSKEADVRKMAEAMNLPFHVVFGQPNDVAPFGDIFAVPTMYLFDTAGRTASIFYGAPPDLHEKAQPLLDRILE